MNKCIKLNLLDFRKSANFFEKEVCILLHESAVDSQDSNQEYANKDQ